MNIQGNINRTIHRILLDLPIGQSFWARAISPSMTPLILEGDEIRIRRVDPKSLKKGDIVCFYDPQIRYIVVHRINKIWNTSLGRRFRTKGDYNGEPDSKPLPPNRILGKAVYVRNSYRQYHLAGSFSTVFSFSLANRVFGKRFNTVLVRIIETPIKSLILRIAVKLDRKR